MQCLYLSYYWLFLLDLVLANYFFLEILLIFHMFSNLWAENYSYYFIIFLKFLMCLCAIKHHLLTSLFSSSISPQVCLYQQPTLGFVDPITVSLLFYFHYLYHLLPSTFFEVILVSLLNTLIFHLNSFLIQALRL